MQVSKNRSSLAIFFIAFSLYSSVSSATSGSSYIPTEIKSNVSATKTSLTDIGEIVVAVTAMAWGFKSLRKIL